MINHNKKSWFYTLLSLLLMIMLSSTVNAELKLHISKTANDGIPILIAPIDGGVNSIIEADLKRSGRFTLIDASKGSKLSGFGGTLPRADLQATGAEYIVRGRVSKAGLDVELVSTADGSRVASYRIGVVYRNREKKIKDQKKK